MFAVNSDQAAEAVSNSDYALRRAFASVLEVENAGADVSALIAKLTEASRELTAGVEALNSGNYSASIDHANESLNQSNNVSADAITLKKDALLNASNNWWTTLSLSMVGSAMFLGLLFTIWSVFKRFYKNRL